MIPPWTSSLLPAGVYEADWTEIEERFGFAPRRRRLLQGLRAALVALKAAGCQRAWINGSFVTNKEIPRDFDMCWEPVGVDPALLDPVLLDLTPPRFAQHAKYGGDIFPNVVEGGSGSVFLEFFQVDKDTGDPKGIIEIDLRRLSP